MKFRFSLRWLMWALAALVLLADQASKAWVVANLLPNVPTDVFPWLRPIASFTYVTNRGVAFGLLPQLGDVFTIFGILVIGAIVIFQHTLKDEGWPTYVALGLQIGGAMGNVLDRLFRGQVVDFIDLNFWPMQDWPISNVADVCIVAGVIVLLVGNVVAEQRAARHSAALLTPSADGVNDEVRVEREHENVEA